MQSEKYSRDNAGQSLKKYTLLKKGELAYNHGASKAKQFGCCYQLEVDEALVPFVYHCFSVNKEYAPYISTVLNISTTERQLKKLVSSSVRMDGLLNISYDDYMTVELALPSMDEQQKVSCFLSLLEEKIKKQQKLVEHLKKYKRGLLSSLLDKEEWQTVLMQDVASGFDYGMNSAATEYDGKHKYIRITDIDESTHKYISTECVSPSDLPEAKYKVEENDILFARTGASVGKSYIYDSRDGELYYAGFLIRASVKPDFNSYFVYLNTLTLGYQRWVVLESTRSGQPGINAEQYRNYKFKCPPIEIQNKIANIFIHFDLKLQREQEILDYLLNYKKAMMRNIFV